MPVVPYRSTLTPSRAPSTVQNINVPVNNSMGEALSGMAQIADKHYAKVDEANAQKLLNGYRSDANALRTRFMNTSGQDAYEGIGAYKKSLSDMRSKHFEGAGTGRQKRMLSAAMDSADLAYNDAGYSHAGKELTTWNNKEAEAAVDLHAQDALFNRLDGKASKKSISQIVTQMRMTADSNGVGPEATDLAVLGMTTKVHSSIINAFVAEKDFARAREYFEEKSNLAGIAPSERPAIATLLDKGQTLATQQTLSDDIISKHGGDYSAMLEAAKKTEKGDVREGVVQQINSHIAASKAQEQEDIRQAKREVTQFLNAGNDPDAILNNPKWSEHFSQSDINTMKASIMKGNSFGADYATANEAFLDLQQGLHRLPVEERQAYINGIDPAMSLEWPQPMRQQLMDWYAEQDKIIAANDLQLRSPKQLMLETTTNVVDDMFKAFVKEEKGSNAKLERMQKQVIYNRVVAQLIDEKDWATDNVGLREKARRIAGTLLLQDKDTFGSSDGFLFENLDAIVSDESTASDFFEELPSERQRVLAETAMEAGFPNPTMVQLMRAHLLDTGAIK